MRSLRRVSAKRTPKRMAGTFRSRKLSRTEPVGLRLQLTRSQSSFFGAVSQMPRLSLPLVASDFAVPLAKGESLALNRVPAELLMERAKRSIKLNHEWLRQSRTRPFVTEKAPLLGIDIGGEPQDCMAIHTGMLKVDAGSAIIGHDDLQLRQRLSECRERAVERHQLCRNSGSCKCQPGRPSRCAKYRRAWSCKARWGIADRCHPDRRQRELCRQQRGCRGYLRSSSESLSALPKLGGAQWTRHRWHPEPPRVWGSCLPH